MHCTSRGPLLVKPALKISSEMVSADSQIRETTHQHRGVLG